MNFIYWGFIQLKSGSKNNFHISGSQYATFTYVTVCVVDSPVRRTTDLYDRHLIHTVHCVSVGDVNMIPDRADDALLIPPGSASELDDAHLCK